MSSPYAQQTSLQPVTINEEAVDVAAVEEVSSNGKRKCLIIAGVALVVAAAIGTTVGVLVAKNNTSSTSAGGEGNAGGGGKTKPGSGSSAGVTTAPGTATTATPGSTPASTASAVNPTSDPNTQTPVLTMLAIGDWGGTTGKASGTPGSCCVLYKTTGQINTSLPRYKVDYYSQMYIAALLGQSAKALSPVRVLGHGDNFYWNGVGSADVAYRFQTTFEDVYNDPALAGVPWINVAGNHDIGGSSFICGDKDNAFVECASTAEMLSFLNERFNLQAKYVSPNQNRWVLKDHYYVERVSKGGVSVDIFNVDTNYADSHGARQVCCQCYGYSTKYGYDQSQCNNVDAGDKACAGGNADMYNTCMATITGWATDSLKQATRDIAASTADFKIINTHYSPHYHMSPPKMQAWYDLCKAGNVQVWFNGHTHGFNHDIATWGTHFFENGGGGGIVTETSSGVKSATVNNEWIAAGNPYGYFELSFTKEWLKVQFATFDNSWVFAGTNLDATTPGGIARGHCWYIPSSNYTATGALGVECKSSINTPIGAPIRR
ncbi:calcineurin-like phosphoesterase [Achlya hypogyna]|uniref:Calcineurin-like phosphoesterase n=1 Tax=Achlya hypogyna TaxID=1202772 RepID=A0A1V9ZAR8_ACHHY|nr:calcineurin-like phosphoesterase [Achlya hypogyna]